LPRLEPESSASADSAISAFTTIVYQRGGWMSRFFRKYFERKKNCPRFASGSSEMLFYPFKQADETVADTDIFVGNSFYTGCVEVVFIKHANGLKACFGCGLERDKGVFKNPCVFAGCSHVCFSSDENIRMGFIFSYICTGNDFWDVIV